jgi:hypothetical protein
MFVKELRFTRNHEDFPTPFHSLTGIFTGAIRRQLGNIQGKENIFERGRKSNHFNGNFFNK